jgi:hypothetical protein
MKRFFSHLPAWVGFGQIAGEREHQRDSMFGGGDRIAERGVHHNNTLGGGGGNIDIVDTDAGAADDLEVGRGSEHLLGNLGRGADGEAVIVADDGDQLILGLAGNLVDLDSAVAEDLSGERVHLVGNQYLGHGFYP